MRSEAAVALLLTAVASVSAAEGADRLRGVGPEFKKFYDVSADTFTCISNPTVTIPASRLNDDFCDCPDGSDEPGTAACAYLSRLSPQSAGNALDDGANSTPALPGFYCQNKGHNAQYIPFTHVNDGRCEDACCDGSDEYAGVGGVKCENKCKAVGNEWRRLDNLRKQSTANALKKRGALVAEANTIRRELEDWLRDAKGKMEGLEAKVKTLEQEQAQIERREKGKVVSSGGAAASGGKLGVLSGLARARLDELKGKLYTVREQSNAYKSRVEELEGVLAAFKTDYNPNFNDEGVKRAVRAWDDYAARDKLVAIDADADADIDTLISDAAHGIEWDQFQEGDEEPSDVDVLYQFEAYLPAPLRDWIDTQLRALRLLLVENGILAGSSRTATAGESKAVTDARARVDATQRELDTLRSQHDEKQTAAATRYGPDDAFRALRDKCVSKDAGEYTYELCWLGDVTQISKKGGSRNGMGRFEEFGSMLVDEDVGADGRGLGVGERVTMRFANGAHCWQGPDRSTTVVLACAETEEIWKVMEEEKCVYRIEAGTPAVCTPAAAAGKAERVKDEL